MATIVVDGQSYPVDPQQNLLHTCLSLGLDLPYFCWHPAMGSVGSCRQCAVKQFRGPDDERGVIVMACMTPATDGARISIHDPEAAAFRAAVVEWLMVNHPHDCPVCDEGGECHLQDMTLMTGHVYRGYRFTKRTHRNQYLGPFINHEMNRCIACYRCTRFYRDYAGGRDLDVFAAHDHVYFGRHEDGVLQSEFSGNLVEVCPTGVFTDKSLKWHYTRKWDLQVAPSVCVHCSLGCNILPGERYGQLRRIRNRYNGEVNGYFLCDRGRFGYEFVNSERRVRHPRLGRVGEAKGQRNATRDQALRHLSEVLPAGAAVIGIGSPRASLEANFALRTLVGEDHFFSGFSAVDHHLVSEALRILRDGPARAASLHDAQEADAVLVLGEDVTQTAPMLALALRQSIRRKPMRYAAELNIPHWNDAAVRELIQDEKGPLFIATLDQTMLDEVATEIYRGAPDAVARLGFAIAHALDPNAPPVSDLPEADAALAERIAQTLREAERPLVVAGTGCASQAILQAAAGVAWALGSPDRPADLCLVLPECNSLGLAMLGGGSLERAAEVLKDGEVDAVVVLENDLYRRADRFTVDELLGAARHVVVIDHLENATTARATALLPAATFAEGDGTLVNNEGRAQRFYQVFVPEDEILESWRWVRDIMSASGRSGAERWETLDDVVASLAERLPAFATLPEVAPPEGFRVGGARIPRQPHRYSGRTAMRAHIDVHEPKPPDDPDSPLAFSMEGFKGVPPPALLGHYWAPGWNSVQSLTRFQEEVGGPLRGGDPGLRLIEPASGERPFGAVQVPDSFQRQPGRWLVVPAYHIFGSEELSVHAQGVAELSPQPYLALNPEDAERLGAAEGDEIEITLGAQTLRYPVKLSAALPPGVASLPQGLPGMAFVSLPSWGEVSSAPDEPGGRAGA